MVSSKFDLFLEFDEMGLGGGRDIDGDVVLVIINCLLLQNGDT